LSGHEGTVVGLAFAGDGQVLVTGDADDTTIIWDLTDPALPTQTARLNDSAQLKLRL
jgi:WD40 repeat protein